MPRPGSVAEAELRVVQSRAEVRGGLHSLRGRPSALPPLLVVAAAGVLVGFALARRTPFGAIAGLVASALLRRGLDRLIGRADRPI